MRHLPRAFPGALLCLLLLTGCGARVPEPTPTPTPSPTPTPTEEAAEVEAGEPVVIDVDYVETQLLDNAVLRGEEQRQPSEGTIEDAVATATAALERFLQTQLVDPATRFGGDGIAALLGADVAEGLDAEQRRALGEVDLDVRRVDLEPVATRAIVLTDGDELLSVTLVYEADGILHLADGGEAAIEQRGELLFPAPQDGDWRAEMLEMTLDVPREPAA
jgi:hypothetical protein